MVLKHKGKKVRGHLGLEGGLGLELLAVREPQQFLQREMIGLQNDLPRNKSPQWTANFIL